MTVSSLKNIFFGCKIPLEDSKGCKISDAELEQYLNEAKQLLTHKFGILFEEHNIIMGQGDVVNPNLPTITRAAPDYQWKDFRESRRAAMKLPYTPINQVEKVKLRWGQNGFDILDFPKDWFNVSEKRNLLRLFPGWNSLGTVAHSYGVTSYFLLAINSGRNIPNAWQISYTAGYKQFAVTNATNTTPIIITTSEPHGYRDYEQATIGRVEGNTATNGTFSVKRVDEVTMELKNSIGNGVYIADTGVIFDIYKQAPDLAMNVARSAAINLIPIVAAGLNKGIQSESVSVDGLSQSQSIAGAYLYAGYVDTLKEQYEKFLDTYFSRRAIRMITVN